MKKLLPLLVGLIPACVSVPSYIDPGSSGGTSSGDGDETTTSGPASGGHFGTGGAENLGGGVPSSSGGEFAQGGEGGAELAQGGEGGALLSGAVCWFERVGYGRRCSELGTKRSLESAACATECMADPHCAGFVDYSLYEGLGCWISDETSCTPFVDSWTEEDGGFEYRKVCGDEVPASAVVGFPSAGGVDVTPGDNCYYTGVSDYQECEGNIAYATSDVSLRGASLEQCLAACDARSDCAAVQDWWLGGPSTFECLLHLGTCDAPTQNVDAGRFFKKVCE